MVKKLLLIMMLSFFTLESKAQEKRINYTYNMCDVYNIDTTSNTAEYARTIDVGGSITFSNVDDYPMIIIDYKVYNIVDAIRIKTGILFKTTTVDDDYPIMIECNNYSLRVTKDNSIFVYKPLKNNN